MTLETRVLTASFKSAAQLPDAILRAEGVRGISRLRSLLPWIARLVTHYASRADSAVSRTIIDREPCALT